MAASARCTSASLRIGPQVMQSLDLRLAYGRVVHGEDVDGVFLRQAVFVHAYDDFAAGVDVGLLACGRLLDAHLWNTRFDGFRHAAEAFDFLDVFPCLVGDFVRQRLHVIRNLPTGLPRFVMWSLPGCKSACCGRYARRSPSAARWPRPARWCAATACDRVPHPWPRWRCGPRC